MSATIVQATKISDAVANNPSAAMAVTCSADHAVILAIACVTKTRTVSSIADSAGNTGWVHLAGGGSSTAGFCDLWWNPNLAAGITSITLTYSGTTKVQVSVLEVSGLTGVADVSAGPTNNTTAATTAAQAVTTTNADDFIVAAIGAVTGPSAVAGPFTLSAGATGSTGVGISTGVATVEELTTGTYTATFTIPSEVSTTAIASFKVATGGGVTRHALLLVGVGG